MPTNCHRLVFLILVSLYACVGCNTLAPEEGLFDVFQNELTVLKAFENGSYVDYMASENDMFPKRQKKLNAIILELNGKFDTMNDLEKMSYQKQWHEKFQPVIDDIYLRTNKLVVHTTTNLKPEVMAHIKELAIRRQAIEKQTEQISLKPQFYELPSE